MTNVIGANGYGRNFVRRRNPSSRISQWDSPLSESENRNLSLSYVDDFIAVYLDEKVSKSTTTWPGPLLSKAWKYLQNVYEPLDINFRLTVVLHEDELDNECYILAMKNTTSQNKTGRHPPFSSLLVDCGANSKQSWAVETPQLFEKLFFQLAKIIQNTSNVISSEGISGCLRQIFEIIFYDIYIYLKGDSSADFLNWKSKHLIPKRYFGPVDQPNCFRDWYYPNYDTYGGAQVPRDFFRLLAKFYKRSSVSVSPNAKFIMNDGEFIHFWSEAAGTDLKYFAITNLRWSERKTDFLAPLDSAKMSYHFNYTLNDCNLVFIDNHVAVYFYTPVQIYSNPTYRTISDGWKFISDKYGPFANQSIHTITTNQKNSSRLVNQSCTPLINGIKKYKHNFVSIISAANYVTARKTLQYEDQSVFLDTVFTPIGHLTLKFLAQQKEHWPAYNVSRLTMTSIIVYDMYLGLGLSFLANHWKESQLRPASSLRLGPDETQWFRDWYLKIYETTSKNRDTLKSFLVSLNTTWDRNRKDGNLTRQQMNMGEFVHFWSEAAGGSLLLDADTSFGWNETYQNQFIRARRDFPSFNYSCQNCEHFRWKSYGIQKIKTEANAITIVICTFVCAVIIAFIGVLIKCTIDRKKIKKLKYAIQSLTAEELDEFLSGCPDEGSSEANAAVLSVSYNTKYELSKGRLLVDHHRVLGSGEFGFVFHGILKGDQGSGSADVEVAVKTVKPNIEISYFKALLSEIKILTHLGLHENIVSLLGTVTGNIVNREVYIALELCPKGNLLHYLQRNRHRFQDSWSQSMLNEFQVILNNVSNPGDAQMASSALCNESENLLALSTADLLEWSCQIANGMQYISSKNVIHGDLAARNILLTYENVAKISDFGLSRQLANYSVYQKTSKTPIPWKWLAIESLVDKTFSVHSDVWSFGVTLWEIFSLGAVPYPGKCWDKNFVNNLMSGNRLECPEYGNAEIYNLMMNCWKKVPTDRILFQEILTILYGFSASFPVRRISGYNSGSTCTYAAL